MLVRSAACLEREALPRPSRSLFRFTHSFRARASFKTRSVAKPMGGAITAHGAAQAISQARARGENLPSFTAVPNVMGRLAKLPTNQQGQQ